MAQRGAQLMGAERVIAIDRLPERLAMASEHLGVETIDYTQVDSVVETHKEMTGGRGPDKVHRGGGHGGPRHRRGVRLRPRQAGAATGDRPGDRPARSDHGLPEAQQHGQHYMPRLLEWATAGELDPSFLMTHRMTLEDGAEGYDVFKNKKDGCVRVVFAPS